MLGDSAQAPQSLSASAPAAARGPPAREGPSAKPKAQRKGLPAPSPMGQGSRVEMNLVSRYLRFQVLLTS